jgi:hypothetical protein
LMSTVAFFRLSTHAMRTAPRIWRAVTSEMRGLRG